MIIFEQKIVQHFSLLEEKVQDDFFKLLFSRKGFFFKKKCFNGKTQKKMKTAEKQNKKKEKEEKHKKRKN